MRGLGKVCHVTAEDLMACLEGTLDDERLTRIEDFLRECRGCQVTRTRFVAIVAIVEEWRGGKQLRGLCRRRRGGRCRGETMIDYLEGPHTEAAGRAVVDHFLKCQPCQMFCDRLLPLYPGAGPNLFRCSPVLTEMLRLYVPELDQLEQAARERLH